MKITVMITAVQPVIEGNPKNFKFIIAANASPPNIKEIIIMLKIVIITSLAITESIQQNKFVLNLRAFLL